MKKTQELIALAKRMAIKYGQVTFNVRQCLDDIEDAIKPIVDKHRELIDKSVLDQYDDGLITGIQALATAITSEIADEISKALNPVVMKYWGFLSPEIQENIMNESISEYEALNSLTQPVLDSEYESNFLRSSEPGKPQDF